jgi:hypothetical protein
MAGYFEITDHVRITSFRKEVILLDLRKDKYHIFDPNQSEKLEYVLQNQWYKSDHVFFSVHKIKAPKFSTEAINCFIDNLIKAGFLQPNLQKKMSLGFKEASQSPGSENIDWHLPLNNSEIKFNTKTILFLLTLAKIHFVTKFMGLENLVKIITQSKKRKKDTFLPPLEDINALCSSLNHACRLYPVRTKCLEWASSLTLVGLDFGWDITLNIGVQNYPFMAHAWAEIGGEVVFDDTSLPKTLSKILSVPS